MCREAGLITGEAPGESPPSKVPLLAGGLETLTDSSLPKVGPEEWPAPPPLPPPLPPGEGCSAAPAAWACRASGPTSRPRWPRAACRAWLRAVPRRAIRSSEARCSVDASSSRKIALSMCLSAKATSPPSIAAHARSSPARLAAPSKTPLSDRLARRLALEPPEKPPPLKQRPLGRAPLAGGLGRGELAPGGGGARWHGCGARAMMARWRRKRPLRLWLTTSSKEAASTTKSMRADTHRSSTQRRVDSSRVPKK
mmetsp:Transcript_1570/g.3389  ORF Transcript_1570/g.3389 Transcript_1570/m.3389 type:complete len:254 (-) Transcript_1570:110-871(-)